MRSAWLALFAALLTLLPEVATAGRSRDPLVFTRHVEQLTGDWRENEFQDGEAHGRVYGQDSAVVVEDSGRSRLVLLFGDTYVPGSIVSNSMARTRDFDASDGIDLAYHVGETGAAAPVLEPDQEFRVWLMAPLMVGGDLFAYYYRATREFPNPPPTLGTGLAVMEGAEPPFVRTPLHFEPGEPLAAIGSATVDGDHAYLFRYEVPGEVEGITLVRVPLGSLEDPSAYAFWTESGWSERPERLVPLFDDSNPPSVQWNAYLDQWLSISNEAYSRDGLLSRFVMRTADAITGPWSKPSVLYRAEGEGWGSCYNPVRTAALDRDGGRVFYVTATDSSKYNLDLYEISLDYADADFGAVHCHDDGHQLAGSPPDLEAEGIELRSAGGSVVGLLLEGPSFFQGLLATRARLVLPLASPLEQAAAVELLVEVGAPNGPAFSERHDIATREAIASASLSASALEGDEVLVVETERTLQALLARAALHAAWRAGSTNRIMLRVSRLDDGGETLALASGESGRSARLEACYGSCGDFGAPAIPTAPCRSPDPAPGPAPVYVPESCGIGFELAPALLVLGRLTRRARRMRPRPAG